jgi:hypothetical protein
MTVLPIQWLLARPQWLLARPRRSAAVTRSQTRAVVAAHPGPARRPLPPEHRTYPDLFFADPDAVEDDSRRMRPGTPPR